MAKGSDYKRFLREKGLTQQFRTYQRLRSKRKQRVMVAASNFDGTARRRELLIYRHRGRTIVRDSRDYSIIATSKRSIADIKRDIASKKKITSKIKSSRGWNVESKRERSFLKNETSYISYNQIKNKETKVTLTNRAKKGKFGFAVVDASYISGTGRKVRVQARSSGPHPLYRKDIRQDMIDEAIYNGSVVAGFSPVDVIIHDIFYEYRFGAV